MNCLLIRPLQLVSQGNIVHRGAAGKAQPHGFIGHSQGVLVINIVVIGGEGTEILNLVAHIQQIGFVGMVAGVHGLPHDAVHIGNVGVKRSEPGNTAITDREGIVGLLILTPADTADESLAGMQNTLSPQGRAGRWRSKSK